MTYDLRAAETAAARTIDSLVDLDQTLATIAETARLALPGFDAVGISTVDRQGKVHTRAGTGQLVWELDALQYSLDEGPCYDSITKPDQALVVAPRIGESGRWPNYAPQAVALGLRSQLAVRLHLDAEGTIGGLNMYSTTDEEVDPSSETIAELFATHASIALGNARQIDGLAQALRTRKIIGQAISLVMKEHTLTEDAAFGFLVRTSSHANVKLRDIAARMVAEANEKANR
jgi:GAF domain-containing protein